MKHTPEPWTVDDLRPDGNLEIVGGDDVLVAEVDPNGSEKEVSANAALIAAAPDLLAACEGIMGLLDADLDAVAAWQKEADAVRAAIAKAKGN